MEWWKEAVLLSNFKMHNYIMHYCHCTGPSYVFTSLQIILFMRLVQFQLQKLLISGTEFDYILRQINRYHRFNQTKLKAQKLQFLLMKLNNWIRCYFLWYNYDDTFHWLNILCVSLCFSINDGYASSSLW